MPADYVSELAEQAFKKIAAGTGRGEEIVEILPERPQDAAALANQLHSRPDLQAQVSSLAGFTPSEWLLEQELAQVDERRKKVGSDPVSSSGSPYDRTAASGLMGLCFSGGGIRSATFNLGILQGLAELNLLRSFDYLSSVSGGGYVHQWFAAWTKRRSFEEVERQLVPLPEIGNPGSHPEPLRWLRRYSNYLTPEIGLLAADTWVAFATWLRNTFLNQIILVSALLFLALLPHAIASPALIPRDFPAVAAALGTIFYLVLVAVYFVGRDLWNFGSPKTSGKGGIGQAKGALGQEGVQRMIVLPLMVSALLLALLFPVISEQTFGFHLVLTCVTSGFLLLVLALTIANWRFNGFVRTASYAYPEPGVHINTAAAISGAAVSPNMGYHSNPATAFLLTLFSVRLGWWLRNPRVLDEDGSALGTPDLYPTPSPPFSLLSLVSELLGRTNDTSNCVYLSDGGHFDNMGLYELVRRRCRYIVICDSEEDGALNFGGIGMAIRKARVDFGVDVALDLRPLQRLEDSEYSAAHCVVGTVVYPEHPEDPGTVVYIKSSLTGDEPADVLNYKKQHPVFPHDSTTNQWFTESQFESYRRLGHHVCFSVFEPAGTAPLVDCTDEQDERARERYHQRRLYLAQVSPCASLSDRKRYFQSLRDTWWGPTPEMDRFTTLHSARYEELLTKVRADKALPGFFRMMFSGDGNWKKGRSDEEIEYGVQFSSELIEFIWMVFNQLELVLPEKRDHPYARGWSIIFTKWTKIDVVQDGWRRYRDSYSTAFQRFAESHCVGLPPQKSEQPASTGKD